jgi:hypothetical protein
MPSSIGLESLLSPVQMHPFLPKENDMESQHYRALPHSPLKAETAYHLPDSAVAPVVNLDSAAVLVMTDLRQIAAVTIDADALIMDANQKMMAHGVRTLLVIDDLRNVIGLVTSTDILGEKSMQLTHVRGARHADILVRDVMTPSHRMEVIDLKTVLNARVGDVMATLKNARRQHALVVDRDSDGSQMVRGIFSSTQVERQLDLVPGPPDTGTTFAELETAIGA